MAYFDFGGSLAALVVGRRTFCGAYCASATLKGGYNGFDFTTMKFAQLEIFMIELSGDIWERWEERRAELAAKGRWQLAGLFCGHEEQGFRDAPKKVLYTGKATAGEFN